MSRSNWSRWLCLITIVAATIALAVAPVAASDPPASPRDSLRQAKMEGAPIVDRVTPKPDYASKPALFVDGGYYRQAPTDVTAFVCSAARKGVPIVVLGSSAAEVSKDLNAPYDVITLDGREDKSAVVAEAIILNPDRNVDNPQCGSTIAIGGSNMSLESALEVVQGFLDDQDNRDFGSNGASAAVLLGGAPEYLPWWTKTYYSNYQPYGYFNITRIYTRLDQSLDGSVQYDWVNVEHRLQIVPGWIEWNNSWQSDWTKLKVYPTWNPYPGYTEDQLLLDYDPTYNPGASTAIVAVGCTAGTNGASVTASQSWSYSVADVQVLDYSNVALRRFQLTHQIDENKGVSKSTYLHKPGAAWRLGGGYYWTPDEYYQAQFIEKYWAIWHHKTTPEIRIKVNDLW